MNDPAARRRLTWIVVIGGVLLVAVLFIASAAPGGSPAQPQLPVLDPASTQTPPPAESAAFSLGPSDLISLGWRIGLVIIVIAGSVGGLRWWARRMAAPRSTTGFLRIVDTLPVGNGRTIHLLALGDRVIAIGATQQQITPLEPLTPEEAARVLAAADTPRDPLPIGEFATHLLESIRRSERAARPTRDTFIGGEPGPAPSGHPRR